MLPAATTTLQLELPIGPAISTSVRFQMTIAGFVELKMFI
jgi:hypothetical protein